MVPKAVRVWMTWEVFSFPLQMRRLSVCVRVCGLCGCFSVCAQWTEPCPSQVFGHRCSAQPPCLLPVLFNVFLLLFTGSDPIGATLSQPWQDVTVTDMGPLGWDWWLGPSRQVCAVGGIGFVLPCHSLSVPTILPRGPCDYILYVFHVGLRTPGPLFTQDYKATLLFFILAQEGGPSLPYFP